MCAKTGSVRAGKAVMATYAPGPQVRQSRLHRIDADDLSFIRTDQLQTSGLGRRTRQ